MGPALAGGPPSVDGCVAQFAGRKWAGAVFGGRQQCGVSSVMAFQQLPSAVVGG